MSTEQIIRQLLFCPADKNELYVKALNSEADCIIFDWEDSVANENKQKAQNLFYSWFETHQNNQKLIGIRINRLDSSHGLKDYLFLGEKELFPDFIMLPKIETPEHLNITENLLPNFKGLFIILIETARGVHNVHKILAKHHTKIAYVLIGSADLSSDLQCENSRISLAYSYGKIINSCSQYKIPVIDSPYFNLKNTGEFTEDTKYGKSLGFSARGAIHPGQLSIINQVYSPTELEIEKAKKIIKIANEGVGVLDGEMVDKAMVKKAQQILNLSTRIK